MTPAEPNTPTRRPLNRRVKMWLRRGHLYFGLFLLPWAILYGVTGFLFNHPEALPDQPLTHFGREQTAGTPLDGFPSPRAIAEGVVAALNERQKPSPPYALAVEPAPRFGRDVAFATATSEGRPVNLLVDPRSGAGTVRVAEAKPPPEKAPFAVQGVAPPPKSKGQPADPLFLADSPAERVKQTVPVVFERLKIAAEQITVTSVPPVLFGVEAGGRTWTATYDPLSGSISGAPAEGSPAPSWRRFLTRLHLAHGYPGETNARWYWAVVVDLMAFVMCFWGLTGLVMWWQIKALRRSGAVVLALSAAAATWLGTAMHEVIRVG